MKALTVLALGLALVVGYVLWGVFFYAPLIGGGWTLALVALSAVCILIGIMSKPMDF